MPTHSPRPLHLATNSVTSTPTKDVFSSPSPPSSFRHPKRYSMATVTSSPSPPTPQTSAGIKAARRQSSIGYYPPDSTESPRRGSLLRRKSLETLINGHGAMVPGEGGGSWWGAGDRSSAISLPAAGVLECRSVPGVPVGERPPLTLTEKHADLLRFIAQKESKCLELRSQLAMHEAELAQLKRKWERIVNKGFDRDVASASVGSNADSNSIVLEGIREGVQGVSRLLAAGFSVSATTPLSPTVPATQPKPKPKPRPLSLTHSLIRKSHSPKESDSSISTHATSRSTTTARFSQSSLSSFGEELNDTAEGHLESRELQGRGEENHANDDINAQILMVRDTGATPTMSPNPEFHYQQNQKRKQSLDTQQRLPSRTLQPSTESPSVSTPTSLFQDLGDGATWASDVQPTATKVHRRKSREVARLDVEQLDFSTLSPSVLLLLPSSMSRNSSISPASSPRLGGSPSPAYLEGAKSNGISANRNMRRSNSSSSMSGLAPMSSIPGLGSIAAGVTVSPPPVGSWMDSMGKKLGQLQRSSTFTKSQKRASLLLADMSQSIVNVLAPSPSVTPSISANASASGTPSGVKSSNLSLPSVSPSPSASGSLLDDEDEDTMKFGTAVLQPVASPTIPAKNGAVLEKAGGKENEEEEWNW